MTQPETCPDPLCILDIPDPSACQDCPNLPQPHPSWGGKRQGAGAPVSNLNAIKTGEHSQLIQTAIDKLAADPKLRAFLLLLARAAIDGELPQTTKSLIIKTINKRTLDLQQAALKLKRLRNA